MKKVVGQKKMKKVVGQTLLALLRISFYGAILFILDIFYGLIKEMPDVKEPSTAVLIGVIVAVIFLFFSHHLRSAIYKKFLNRNFD